MKIIIFTILFILTLPAYAENFVVLPKEHARTILGQCSRSAPSYEGEWTPTKEQIDKLEANLDKLNKLVSNECCGNGKIEGKASDYTRQYVGIISNGKKLIYINALGADLKVSINSPAIVCDGGKSFWGAVYDPETGVFSQLAFNGVA
jgi:hypothetical protein